MNPITFEVVGLPAPQGSKTAMMIGGHPRVIEGSSTTGRVKHKNWRTAVADTVRQHVGDNPPMDGPLYCTVEFRFPMPNSRPAAVRRHNWGWQTSRNDIDKLLRATFDGLTAGGLIRDDSLLCHVVASKFEVRGWTGATITVSEISLQPKDI